MEYCVQWIVSWNYLIIQKAYKPQIFSQGETPTRVNFGPTCCKAITLVSDHCLPKLFPFNPAFHSTLKNVCLIASGVGGPTPSPLGVD